jgi:hypothetical protein
MADEATPVGTSTESVASAVDALLAAEAPVEDIADELEVVAEAVEVEDEDTAPPELEASEIVDSDDPEADDDEVGEVVADDTYTVRVGDEDVELTLEELQSGYLRQSDYTKKTQTVAEARKRADAELASIAETREAYAARLSEMEQALSQPELTAEQWAELEENDPIAFLKAQNTARDRRDTAAAMQAEQQRVQEEKQRELQADVQASLVQETEKLLEVIPEWRDEEVAAEQKTALYTYAQRNLGFSQEELYRMGDHRAVNTLRKAYLYDQLMDKKPGATKKTKQAPKMAKGGQPASKRQISAKRKRQQLLNISNSKGRKSIDAAVDLLMEQ